MKLRTQMPELTGATTLLNHKGTTITKQKLIGKKPTLIHFWSVSCHSCKQAMFEVNALRDKYNGELNVIAVHMPRAEQDTDIGKIKEMAKTFNITQPIFVDNAMSITDAFNNQYVPAYYLFDKSGILRHYQAGGIGIRLVEKRVNRILLEMRNQ